MILTRDHNSVRIRDQLDPCLFQVFHDCWMSGSTSPFSHFRHNPQSFKTFLVLKLSGLNLEMEVKKVIKPLVTVLQLLLHHMISEGPRVPNSYQKGAARNDADTSQIPQVNSP